MRHSCSCRDNRGTNCFHLEIFANKPESSLQRLRALHLVSLQGDDRSRLRTESLPCFISVGLQSHTRPNYYRDLTLCSSKQVSLIKKNSPYVRENSASSLLLKGKAVQLHAMETLGGTEGIAPTHSRPRH
jgi:hypothetical protein